MKYLIHEIRNGIINVWLLKTVHLLLTIKRVYFWTKKTTIYWPVETERFQLVYVALLIGNIKQRVYFWKYEFIEELVDCPCYCVSPLQPVLTTHASVECLLTFRALRQIRKNYKSIQYTELKKHLEQIKSTTFISRNLCTTTHTIILTPLLRD